MALTSSTADVDAPLEPNGQLPLASAAGVGERRTLDLDWRSISRPAYAAALGAFIPLSGFAPLNHAADLLSVQTHPWLVVLLPSTLLCLVALALSWPLARHHPSPPARVALFARIAALTLVLAGALSLLGSDSWGTSAALLVLAVLGPLALYFALRRSAIPLDWVCGGFLTVNAALLLRDDWVFLRDHGLPTGHALFLAKFSNAPYDFHYYGLQNPDTFATFLLIPLALSVFWATARRTSSSTRRLLLLNAALCFFTLGLTYIRLDIAFGVLVVLYGIFLAPARARTRAIGAAAVLGAVVLFVSSVTTFSYFSDAAQTGRTASANVRLRSIGSGLLTTAHHPVLGVGLGRYEPVGTPAHSSLAQAGAEMGVLGLVAVLGLTGWFIWRAWRLRHLADLRFAAAAALGLYVLVAAISGGARLGLVLGYVNVWALAVALLAAVSETEPGLSASWTSRGEPAIGHAFGSRSRVLRFMASRPAGILLALAVVAGAGVMTLRPLSRTAASPPSRSAEPVTATDTRWNFAAGLTHGWTVVHGSRLYRAAGGSRVVTSGPGQTYQLLGPVLDLRAGVYELRLNARVVRGGMAISVLDVARQRFIDSLAISGAGGKARELPLRLPRGALVEVILSDFRVSPRPSIWVLRSVVLTPANRTIAPPGASPSKR